MKMSDSNQSTALANLTATYTDSDASDDESRGHSSGNKTKAKSSGLVSYNVEDHDKDEGDDEADDNKSYWVVKKEKVAPPPPQTPSEENSVESTIEVSTALITNGDEDVILPPEPPGRCSSQLQEKIARLYEKKVREGKDMNASIQKRKDFRNPSIYEKLISFCLIDELGTNYPSEIYDPHSFSDESFYEELAKAQKVEMDKRQKERTKVEFVSGTKKSNNSTTSTVQPPNDAPTSKSTEENKKRKSKWDVGAAQAVAIPPVIKPLLTQPPGIVPVTSTASGTKATVISAFGTITKKAKQ